MSHRRGHLALLLTLAMAGGFSGATAARADVLAGKSDQFLARAAAAHPKHGWVKVIVRFISSPTAAQKARLTALGATIYRDLPIIQSAALSLPARSLEKLAALPFVQRLSADLDVKKSDEFTTESSGADMAFTQHQLTGAGVGVAVIDSGISNAQDLGKSAGGKDRLLKGVSFVAAQHGNKMDTDDACGHGTHVAGIIGGNGKSSTVGEAFRTFYGVARGVSLIPVKVLDENGQGTVSQVVSGIQWAVQNRSVNNIRVINLSLGHPVGESYMTDPLCQAAEQAWKAGIVVVCSAGNSGRLQNNADPNFDNEGYGSAYGSIQAPGNDPFVITVGAMKATDLEFGANGAHTHSRANDRIATYSSRGPSRLDLVLKADIIAPGNKVISLEASKDCTLFLSAGTTNHIAISDYRRIDDTSRQSDRYFRLSGTSMAAPVVAGAAALMLQKDASLSPDAIKVRLMVSADKWRQPDGACDPCTFGAGYLNIPAALSCTALPNQAANSPTLKIDADGNVTINMDRAIWGHDIAGANAVWGISGVNDLRAIWGHDTFADGFSNLLNESRAIWGRSISAERAIWGHTVWEDRAIWGHSVEGVDLSSTAINGEK